MRPRVPGSGVCQAAGMTDTPTSDPKTGDTKTGDTRTGDTMPVRIERDGDVAVVVLDSPPLNLFDAAVFDAIEAVADELVRLTDPADPARARAVLVEARGKVVSGGVDVTVFRDIAEGPEPAERGAELWRRLLRVAQTFEDLPVPTVFAAHGLTLTAAFELALACDILLAAERARSEEHTSELQSRQYLVCRLLLEKKKRSDKPPSALQ